MAAALFTLSAIWPWYFAWLLPLAALQPTSLLSRFITGRRSPRLSCCYSGGWTNGRSLRTTPPSSLLVGDLVCARDASARRAGALSRAGAGHRRARRVTRPRWASEASSSAYGERVCASRRKLDHHFPSLGAARLIQRLYESLLSSRRVDRHGRTGRSVALSRRRRHRLRQYLPSSLGRSRHSPCSANAPPVYACSRRVSPRSSLRFCSYRPGRRPGLPLLRRFCLQRFINSLREGNTTHFILLALAAALLLIERGRDLAAGAIIGFCATIKLPLLLFGAYFVSRGRWRAATGGFAAVAAVGGDFSILVFGTDARAVSTGIALLRGSLQQRCRPGLQRAIARRLLMRLKPALHFCATGRRCAPSLMTRLRRSSAWPYFCLLLWRAFAHASSRLTASAAASNSAWCWRSFCDRQPAVLDALLRPASDPLCAAHDGTARLAGRRRQRMEHGRRSRSSRFP